MIKLTTLFSLVILTVLVILSISSCGAQFGPDYNFEVAAKLSDSLAGGRGVSGADPYEYHVVVKKFELLEGTDDATPVVIYESDNSYYFADLTGIDPTYLGSGMVDPGIYTHCRTTIVAISQQIDVFTDNPIKKTYVKAYQDFDNSDSITTDMPSDLISKGDVLVYEEDGFNWFEINELKEYSFSLVKSDVTSYNAPVDDGEDVQTVELTSPVTIEEGKKYTGTLTFEVDGTFIWEDTDDDSQFEPTSDDHSGLMNGFTFDILMPQITAVAVSNQ
jgi:hypothetical protein